MKKQRPSIDGFVPRRSGDQLGNLHRQAPSKTKKPIAKRELHTGDKLHRLLESERATLARSEIDASLRDIDQPIGEKKLTRKQRREIKRPLSRKQKIIKWVSIAFVVLLVGLGGYFAYKTFSTGSKVFKGNILDVFTQNQPLKQDSNGRSNILVFGTAEDSEGGAHGGASLTDSLIVLSVDQTKKDAYMISIPRDLWVDYAETCTVGNSGKINATYFCASEDGANEEAGSAALRDKVGEITGLDIQYDVHVNFTAVVEAVDAVGGVDIKVESEDPRGILDRNMDWKCNNTCYYVNYKNGEIAHMDGEHALAFSRARNANGGYGLPGGNFDREKNQQKVILALREKAVSVGTLTNIGAVTGLMDTLGNNLHTNFDAKEIRTLMALGNDVKTDMIKPISLVDEEAPLVTTGNVSGQSIVRPIAGLLDYSEIRAHIREQLSSDPAVKERAQLAVLNGSSVAGVARVEAEKLTGADLSVSFVGNAPDATYADIEVYQLAEGKPATAAKLKQLLGVDVKVGPPPFTVAEGTDFVIIFGKQRI